MAKNKHKTEAIYVLRLLIKTNLNHAFFISLLQYVKLYIHVSGLQEAANIHETYSNIDWYLFKTDNVTGHRTYSNLDYGNISASEHKLYKTKNALK